MKNNNQLKIKQTKKPWGEVSLFFMNQAGSVQILFIKKGEELSLHYHKIRDDNWYILEGEGIVTLDEQEILAKAGDIIFLPKDTNHKALALKDLKIMEVCFDNFQEEDTYRLKDKYNRV